MGVLVLPGAGAPGGLAVRFPEEADAQRWVTQLGSRGRQVGGPPVGRVVRS